MFIAKFKYDGNDPEPIVLVVKVTDTHLEGYNLNYASPSLDVKTITDMMIFSAGLLLIMNTNKVDPRDPEAIKDYGYKILERYPELENTYRKYNLSGLKGRGIHYDFRDYSA